MLFIGYKYFFSVIFLLLLKRFTCNMNKRVKFATLIALIGVIAILALQVLWVSTFYKQEQKKLIQKALPLVEQATHKTIIENAHIWWNTIQNLYGKDIIPYKGGLGYYDSMAVIKVYNPTTGLYNTFEHKCNKAELIKYGMGAYILYHVCEMDIMQFCQQLDSIFQANDIRIPHIVEKVNIQTGRVEKSTNDELYDGNFTVVCDTLQLGITGTDGVVVKFDGSYAGMFAQIRFILLSSFAITLLVAVILFGIIRIIVYQQKLSDFRENFVRHMIHEIRNPIGYLKRVLDFASRTNDDKNLQTASKKIGHINLLIEKLLSTTSNSLKIQTQKIDIRNVLENIRESYPDADIRLEIAPDITTFRADPLHYSNALLNLVDNAIKYSPDEKRVRIHCYKEKRNVCVLVQDWGIGIPLEFQLMIFDRYFRVPLKKSVNVSGFGLGLGYVKMVAEAHGGTIAFSSIYKQGSEFIICIPYDND